MPLVTLLAQPQVAAVPSEPHMTARRAEAVALPAVRPIPRGCRHGSSYTGKAKMLSISKSLCLGLLLGLFEAELVQLSSHWSAHRGDCLIRFAEGCGGGLRFECARHKCSSLLKHSNPAKGISLSRADPGVSLPVDAATWR